MIASKGAVSGRPRVLALSHLSTSFDAAAAFKAPARSHTRFALPFCHGLRTMPTGTHHKATTSAFKNCGPKLPTNAWNDRRRKPPYPGSECRGRAAGGSPPLVGLVALGADSFRMGMDLHLNAIGLSIDAFRDAHLTSAR